MAIRTLTALGLAVGLWFGSAKPSSADYPPLGVNLSGVRDWSTEFVFLDAFKSARPWISQKKGAGWGQGGPLAVNARGFVEELAPGQFAETLMFVEQDGKYAGGEYVFSCEGAGSWEFAGAAKAHPAGGEAGGFFVTVEPAKGQIQFRVLQTDKNNPLRNFQLVPVKEWKKNEFVPKFLARAKLFKFARFMDMQDTNNSKISKWADRPTPGDFTQGDKGVALEHLCELCKAADIDGWFCVPHLADDNYVARMAKLLAEQMPKGKKVYVEYSNETWNGQFEQAKYCQRKGKELGLSKNDYEAQLRYSARRSVEIFKIFAEAFGGTDRLMRVIATHSANPWSGSTELDFEDAYKSADAVAIAPYFGNAFGDPKAKDANAKLTVDALLDGLEESIAKNREPITAYAKMAKERKLNLMAYEGGQHLAGFGGAENDDRLTKLFHAANRHARMKDLYLQDLKQWAELGGMDYALFSSVGRYSKWGSWGLLEHQDQDEKAAPKYQAVLEALGK